MSVYVIIDDAKYSDIKSVSFIPETDPTLGTLPICEFTAEIKTSTPAETFKKKISYLYENRIANDNLLAGYYIVYESKQVSSKVVRIVAKSVLQYLEGRTMPAKVYENCTGVEFLDDLFRGAAEEEDEPADWLFGVGVIPADYVGWSGYYVGGPFPAQTARERLQMYCQQVGLCVGQWGENSRYGLWLENYRLTPYYPAELILPENVYYKPKYSMISKVGKVIVDDHPVYTWEYHEQENGWSRYTIMEGWADPDSGLELDGEYIYYTTEQATYTYDGPDDDCNEIVMISDNLFMRDSAYNPQLKSAYFLHYEVEMDVLCERKRGDKGTLPSGAVDEYFYPSQKVYFRLGTEKGDSCREGIVKSVEYIFGTMTRVKLRILTDMQEVSTYVINVVHQYYGLDNNLHEIARTKYYIPYGTWLSITVPLEETAFDGDRIVRLRRRNNYPGYINVLGPTYGAHEQTWAYTFYDEIDNS